MKLLGRVIGVWIPIQSKIVCDFAFSISCQVTISFWKFWASSSVFCWCFISNSEFSLAFSNSKSPYLAIQVVVIGCGAWRLHHSVPCFQLCSVLLQSYLNPWFSYHSLAPISKQWSQVDAGHHYWVESFLIQLEQCKILLTWNFCSESLRAKRCFCSEFCNSACRPSPRAGAPFTNFRDSGHMSSKWQVRGTPWARYFDMTSPLAARQIAPKHGTQVLQPLA